ncbi:hypothetical protein amrb99_24750 [Actinomadura sp. RB99]|nr:hypothetical protein [Actinomadura sp. RB99]
MTPWWPCRVSGSKADTYAIKGYSGLFFADGRRYVPHSGRKS